MILLTVIMLVYSHGKSAGFERASNCVLIASLVTFAASLLILFKLLMITCERVLTDEVSCMLSISCYE